MKRRVQSIIYFAHRILYEMREVDSHAPWGVKQERMVAEW